MKPKSCSFEDTRLFSQLLKSGYSFTQCLSYLEDKTNQDCFNSIKEKLKQGESLQRWAGTFFHPCIQNDLNCFIRFLPLNDALELSILLYEKKDSYQKELIRMTGYPFLMFVFSLIGVQIFCAFCMPALIQMMKGFDVDSMPLEIIYHGLMICAFVLTLVLLAAVMTICVFVHPSNIVKGVQFLYQYHLGFLIEKELSSHFAMLYYHCVRMGIPTRQALLMLKECTAPLTRFLADSIQQILQNGGDLVEAVGICYLDSSLQKLMKTAMVSQSVVVLLEGYLEIAEVKRRKRLKQIAYAAQLAAYVFVAIMIILVYQVLFLPLSMLERM